MTAAQQVSAARPLRVAIVGAGPAGIYTAEALVEQDDVPVSVDLIDRLPTPFGLVRHGIAPDHLAMRALRDTLHEVLEHERVRFIGNVEVGADLTLAELRRSFDLVVYTFGASGDRRIGIDGEDLAGVLPATAFVSWYTGHPDADRAGVEAALAGATDVVVVGVGNVALDVARLLARSPTELEHTDMPQHVLDALAAAPVERVTVLGRRGPAQARFTTKELRELGRLDRATVLVDARQLVTGADPVDRIATRNLATLREWTGNEVEPGRVSIRLRFYSRPRSLHGADHVTGLEVERMEPGTDSVARGTGESEVIPADLVIRSVGYNGQDMAGLPVDRRSGTVLNRAGRVLRDGEVSAGEYVAGWIKRGPSGVVGTNKVDAAETVASLLADVSTGRLALGPPAADLVELLTVSGVRPVLLTHWQAIDAAERALGATRGRGRTVLHRRDDLLAAAHTREHLVVSPPR